MAAITLVSVVGARPQFVKLAPVCRALAEYGVDCRHLIIHTGQHYDPGMSDVFFDELAIPKPYVNLNVGSGKHGQQTAAMMAALESEFEQQQPAAVIVYGDTNSTLAAAIAAAKLRIPQFHIEAGLRSFDRHMPEEVNRVIADHCADLLFAPTDLAMQNLASEGLADRSIRVGDVMYDAVLYSAERADRVSTVVDDLALKKDGFALVTLHRAATTSKEHLADIMQTVCDVADRFLPVVFPMHPRTRAAFADNADCQSRNLHLTQPRTYLDMLSLIKNARLVLTDSGGLQKEAAFLGTPCITARDSTEWTETIDIGANRLTGLAPEAICAAVAEVLQMQTPDWSEALASLYGDGRAAARIATGIFTWLEEHRSGTQGGQK